MDIYSALADPNRRRIIELIASKGRLTATDISDSFQVSAPAISQHLKILRETHLVDMEKHAQSRVYSVNTKGLLEIEIWSSKIRKMWEMRLGRLDSILKELK